MILTCKFLKRFNIQVLPMLLVIIVTDSRLKQRKILMNHYKIILAQQKELWFIGYYLLRLYYRVKTMVRKFFSDNWYRLDLDNRTLKSDWRHLKFRFIVSRAIAISHDPLHIEACANERRWTYLRDRKSFAFKKYK